MVLSEVGERVRGHVDKAADDIQEVRHQRVWDH